MEKILSVLKQLSGQAGFVTSIPKPIKVTLTFFGAVVGILVVFKYAHLDQSEKIFLVIALVLLALITAGYYGWKALTQKQQNQQFGGDISQHSSATPRGLSDPGQRARLDDMRKKFQSGVDAYKSRGKDLYKLPWYVIVGEPGSGKTEAVRHSNVGFPPGMQDEFQGVGGTINMNWWFTNHAVLLDTAGRLMFEDVKPGETSEWKEFLSLLKKNRPNCPINGLFLVIPSDSLIKDSADSIQKKAGKIAQQLDVIQRVLDVRFPVFVVVTKCDKINGFREFFDGLTDPQLQHQMMGWSNPDQLDEPFKPDMVDKHLEQVAARLRRRRLGLLRDPVAETTEGRRTDEVDSLYALPHSLESLSSRLRRYLETIFIAGEWSAKPLFLRGIYFSSSMREGAALDAELAEAIGVGVDELPEGKVWERERAYFLRDLFLEKVFREKGLVTRATNTKRMLRGQQIALYASGFAGLALFCAFAWFARSNLRSGVKDQGDYWHAVARGGWENKYWKRSIVPMRTGGFFASEIDTNTVLVDTKPVQLGEFHAKLAELAQKPLKKNMFFPWLADKYNENSRKAQRIVFEAGVVRPLVEATRQKMRGPEKAEPYQADALIALIQLEADVLSRGATAANSGMLSPEGARKFLGSMENYVAGQEVLEDTNLVAMMSNLVAVMSWIYSTNDNPQGAWAPHWLSGGSGSTNNLAVNTGISVGLDVFSYNATNSQQTQLSQWTQISTLLVSAAPFSTHEEKLFSAAKRNVETEFLTEESAVEKASKDLDEAVKKAEGQDLFTNGVLLTKAHRVFCANVSKSAGSDALARIRQVNDAALAVNKGYPLFKEIKGRLDAIQALLSSQVTESLANGDTNQFRSLDETCLADSMFHKRTELYIQAKGLMAEKPFAKPPLVGAKGEPWEKFVREKLEPIRKKVGEYSGKLANELTNAVSYQLSLVEKYQSLQFYDAYLAEANRLLERASGFPLFSNLSKPMAADVFLKAGANLKLITEDLKSTVLQKAPQDAPKWKTFLGQVAEQQVITKALGADDGKLGNCTISLAASTDATATDDEWQRTWRDLKLFSEGGSNEPVRTGFEPIDQKIGDTPVYQKLELRLYKNARTPDSPTFPIATGEWGPLELIHKFRGERSKVETTTWLVKLPVGAPGAKGLIRLKLKFDGVLPELDKWPTQ